MPVPAVFFVLVMPLALKLYGINAAIPFLFKSFAIAFSRKSNTPPEACMICGCQVKLILCRGVLTSSWSLKKIMEPKKNPIFYPAYPS